MTSVQLHQVEHRFEATPALNGLDWSVESGAYVVLLGENGCGKTTALRVIAGLVRPDRGSVFLGGACVDGLPPRSRSVSMAFQSNSLYPHLTVGQNLRFGKGSKDGASRAAELMNLTSLIDRYPHQLSGGQARRAAIAKAVAGERSVRLLDEPLGSLDSETATRLELELRIVHEATGGTTIHVTHRADEAMRIADKIAVMHAGRLLQFDRPAEIQRSPASIEVAKVISTSPLNMFAAVWSDGQLRLTHDSVNAVGDWSGRLSRMSSVPRELTLAVPASKVGRVMAQDGGAWDDEKASVVVHAKHARRATVGSQRSWSALLGAQAFHAVESVVEDDCAGESTGDGDREPASTAAHNSFLANAEDIWLFDGNSGAAIS